MLRAVVAAILCAACQGKPAAPPPGAASDRRPVARDAAPLEAGSAIGSTTAAPSPGSDSVTADGAGTAAAAAGDGEPHARGDEPDVPDPSRVIAELGAIPAWQAVIDRAQLLGRRGQHGVVYGRVGPPVMVPAPPGTVPPPGAAATGAVGQGSSVATASTAGPGTAAPAGAFGAGPALAPPGASSVVGAPGAGPAGAVSSSSSAGSPGAVPSGAGSPGAVSSGAVPSGVGASGVGASGVGSSGVGASGAVPSGAVPSDAGSSGAGPSLTSGAAGPARPLRAGVAGGLPSVAAAGPANPPGARPAGEPVLVASPYTWLIDDTEGNGALGIRIALGDKAKEGDRIAAGGAWQLDADRRWFWKADAVQALPPAAPSEIKDPPAPLPNHVVATAPLPPGARTVSLARDNDLIYFQVVGAPPVTDGDGWLVADELGSPIALVLNLPGERATYGGQDMRAVDERWQLRRAQTYWLRIGRLHKHGDKPPSANARTAPVRLP